MRTSVSTQLWNPLKSELVYRHSLKLFGPFCTSREYSPLAIRRRNHLRHEGHLLWWWWGGEHEVMSGWARQPLPQLIALLRIMTRPQPIPARGHLHLHLLIFYVVHWVFSMHTHNTYIHAGMHAHSPEQTLTAFPYWCIWQHTCKSVHRL